MLLPLKQLVLLVSDNLDSGESISCLRQLFQTVLQGMAKFRKICETDTGYNADSVEWCPIEGFQDVLVCGTYNLCETGDLGNQRVGSLLLFKLKYKEVLLDLIQTIEMPGVLDCKWANCKVLGKMLLAVANALGRVQIYELEDSLKLNLICEYNLVSKGNENNVLALSLDWCLNASTSKLAVSDSRGCISILSFNSNFLEQEFMWEAHKFEAWSVSFNKKYPNIVYTGGDDCKLNIYDTNKGVGVPISSNGKCHLSGVTNIHCNSTNEYYLLTGSYDENLRYFDTRSMKSPVASVNLGGGIWRLKWDPENLTEILAACMHNGFCAINSELKTIVAEYKEHKSLAYGVDWCFLRKPDLSKLLEENEVANYLSLIAACSFYDHTLSLALLLR